MMLPQHWYTFPEILWFSTTRIKCSVRTIAAINELDHNEITFAFWEHTSIFNDVKSTQVKAGRTL